MSFLSSRCNHWMPFLRRHNWGRWEVFSDGNITQDVRGIDGDKKTLIIGRFVYQKRACVDCHYVEYDQQEKT